MEWVEGFEVEVIDLIVVGDVFVVGLSFVIV